MSKLIVKDRKLCIVNRRLVTDAGGAPCVCDGGPIEPNAPCDGERPCAFNLRVSGITIPPELPAALGATVRIVQFAGLNGVRRLSGNTIPSTATFPILLSVEWSRFWAGKQRTVTFTWTKGLVSFNGVVSCDSKSNNFGISGRVTAVASCSPGSISIKPELPVPPFGFGEYFCGSPGLLAQSDGVNTVGQNMPDTRTPPPMPWSYSTYNSLFLPYAGSASLAGWIFDCENEEPESSVYLAVSCDKSSVIAVDLATNIDGNISPKVGDVLYRVIDEQTNTPPTTVDWVDEACPAEPPPIDGVLWQRCTNPSERVRTSNDLGAAQFMTWTQVRPNRPHPTIPGTVCTETSVRAYERVVDDDGSHPTVAGVAHAGPCSAMTESVNYTNCTGEFDGDGEPQNPQALQSPPPYNPMAAQINAFGCSGGGDPGVW